MFFRYRATMNASLKASVPPDGSPVLDFHNNPGVDMQRLGEPHRKRTRPDGSELGLMIPNAFDFAYHPIGIFGVQPFGTCIRVSPGTFYVR